MRLHDEESGFSPSSVHMPRIKKGQLIHRFDVLRQSLLCVWAIALSTSEQVSRETMENNRVQRASTRAVACQRRRTCFGGVGRSRCRWLQSRSPSSMVHGFRTSLCVFHVVALPGGGRRVVLFRTLASYGFRRKGQESVDQDRGRA